MPERRIFGGQGIGKSHLFLGSNTVTHALLGHADLVKETESWALGEDLIRENKELYDLLDAPSIELGEERLGRFMYLSMSSVDFFYIICHRIFSIPQCNLHVMMLVS